jgi:hypothetical protein
MSCRGRLPALYCIVLLLFGCVSYVGDNSNDQNKGIMIVTLTEVSSYCRCQVVQ